MREQSHKCSLLAALLFGLIRLVFSGLADGRNPLRGPRDFIESKAGRFGDGIVANECAVDAVSSRVKAGR